MGAFRDSMRERALEKAQAKRNGFLQKINSQKGRICVCFSSPSSTKDLQDIDNSINIMSNNIYSLSIPGLNGRGLIIN